MKKGSKIVLILALTLVLFAVLKPSKESFKGFVKERYEKIDSEDSWKDITKKSTINIGRLALNAQSLLTVKYEDKIFFALAGRYKMDYEEKYLGILGIWIKIK